MRLRFLDQRDGQTTFYHQLEAQHLPASPLKKGRKPNTPIYPENRLIDSFTERRYTAGLLSNESNRRT